MSGEPRMRDARIGNGTLARFAGEGLTWPGILKITNGKRRGWWRVAVAEAEERGVIEWDRPRLAWILTNAGRKLVKDVA